ncbi:MAG: class II aldolase [Betaproteobacteria bacterium RBG_16_66_20]|nr:MAG: class II aldolase [Betaproteobacteria bacterium RBG_16_66_20]OGA65066.1 MAG: class II aldolase [Betaproteobacteria bacterium RIFCSPLOWO2_12_FULL_68_20]
MTIYHQGTARAVRKLPMSKAEREARIQLAACYRIFNHLGWVEMIFNHITLRVPGPEKLFLINPFGLHYSEITASSLILIDLEGNPQRETRWPVNRAGFVIHSTLHGAIAEVNCVMHTHTTTGMAVACLKEGLSPTNFYAAQLQGGVAYHDFEGITVEDDERRRLVASVGSKRALILRNHGLLAWGASLPEAFLTLWTLQRACDVQIASSSAGDLNPIRPEVFAQTVRESGPGEKRTCEDVFAAMQRIVDAKDPSYRV